MEYLFYNMGIMLGIVLCRFILLHLFLKSYIVSIDVENVQKFQQFFQSFSTHIHKSFYAAMKKLCQHTSNSDFCLLCMNLTIKIYMKSKLYNMLLV